MDGSLIRDIQFDAKMPLGEGSAYEEHAILVGCNFDVVHLRSKMLHNKTDSTPIISSKCCDFDMNEIETELDRWRDILFTDYNLWLLNNS